MSTIVDDLPLFSNSAKSNANSIKKALLNNKSSLIDRYFDNDKDSDIQSIQILIPDFDDDNILLIVLAAIDPYNRFVKSSGSIKNIDWINKFLAEIIPLLSWPNIDEVLNLIIMMYNQINGTNLQKAKEIIARYADTKNLKWKEKSEYKSASNIVRLNGGGSNYDFHPVIRRAIADGQLTMMFKLRFYLKFTTQVDKRMFIYLAVKSGHIVVLDHLLAMYFEPNMNSGDFDGDFMPFYNNVLRDILGARNLAMTKHIVDIIIRKKIVSDVENKLYFNAYRTKNREIIKEVSRLNLNLSDAFYETFGDSRYIDASKKMFEDMEAADPNIDIIKVLDEIIGKGFGAADAFIVYLIGKYPAGLFNDERLYDAGLSKSLAALIKRPGYIPTNFARKSYNKSVNAVIDRDAAIKECLEQFMIEAKRRIANVPYGGNLMLYSHYTGQKDLDMSMFLRHKEALQACTPSLDYFKEFFDEAYENQKDSIEEILRSYGRIVDNWPKEDIYNLIKDIIDMSTYVPAKLPVIAPRVVSPKMGSVAALPVPVFVPVVATIAAIPAHLLHGPGVLPPMPTLPQLPTLQQVPTLQQLPTFPPGSIAPHFN